MGIEVEPLKGGRCGGGPASPSESQPRRGAGGDENGSGSGADGAASGISPRSRGRVARIDLAELGRVAPLPPQPQSQDRQRGRRTQQHQQQQQKQQQKQQRRGAEPGGPSPTRPPKVRAAAAPVAKKRPAAGGEKRSPPPLRAYLILIAALLSLSSLGAALKLQGSGVTPTMKAYWRMVATAVALSPLALRSVLREGPPPWSARQARLFGLCAGGYATMTGSFAVSLSMSSLAETFILGNVGSLVLICWKVVTGQSVLMMEGLGATIGFLGGVICAYDEDDTDVTPLPASERHHPVKGGLIAFLASVGLALYLTLAKDLRGGGSSRNPPVNLSVFMFLMMSVASTCLLAYMALSGEHMSLSAHHEHGLWGWTNLTADRLPLEIHLAVVCNLVGTLGYVASMRYFDPVVVSTVCLLEPLLAAVMGAAAGVDDLPGVRTWVGGTIVTTGCYLVARSDAQRGGEHEHDH